MKKVTFTNSMKRGDFRKYITYKLRGHSKFVRYVSYEAKSVIFEVETFDGMLFYIDNCWFMDARINKHGKLSATFTCSIEKLPSILNEISFFRRNPDRAEQLGFPEIWTAKKHVDIPKI